MASRPRGGPLSTCHSPAWPRGGLSLTLLALLVASNGPPPPPEATPRRRRRRFPKTSVCNRLSVICASRNIDNSRSYDPSTRSSSPQSSACHRPVPSRSRKACTSSRRCWTSWAWLMAAPLSSSTGQHPPGRQSPLEGACHRTARSTLPLALGHPRTPKAPSHPRSRTVYSPAWCSPPAWLSAGAQSTRGFSRHPSVPHPPVMAASPGLVHAPGTGQGCHSVAVPGGALTPSVWTG